MSAFKTDLVTLHLTASQVPLPVSVIEVLDEHVSVGERVLKLWGFRWFKALLKLGGSPERQIVSFCLAAASNIKGVDVNSFCLWTLLKFSLPSTVCSFYFYMLSPSLWSGIWEQALAGLPKPGAATRKEKRDAWMAKQDCEGHIWENIWPITNLRIITIKHF